DLPSIASGYLQLTFNLFLLLILLYFLVSFILTIQSDVNKKVEEYSAEILSEISQCSKEYLENRCSPDQRVPAMQSACQAWERCMERDPQKVGRARVSAETFAEIVNSFIEPISYKTMVFVLGLVLGSLFVSNFAFSVLRQKSTQHQQQQQQQQQQQ
ncbi:Brl1/Brr6 domain-containing protein, partial [Protomyces lactucae-debilis]